MKQRPRTVEEYQAQAMLLGAGWYYDDYDHTMTYDKLHMSDSAMPMSYMYHPDTMELLGGVFDERYKKHFKEWRRR